jgi:hypothetical protein
LIPPVDQISPPLIAVLKKPAEFAWRAGFGRFGGEATHVPLGHELRSSWSTAVVLSKKPPPGVSPPIANSFEPSDASPKSARVGVNVGPFSHVPVFMSRRIVCDELAGAAAPRIGPSRAEVSACPRGPFPNPPTM